MTRTKQQLQEAIRKFQAKQQMNSVMQKMYNKEKIQNFGSDNLGFSTLTSPKDKQIEFNAGPISGGLAYNKSYPALSADLELGESGIRVDLDKKGVKVRKQKRRKQRFVE